MEVFMSITKKKTLQGFSVAMLALIITACGGGGSDDSAPAATPPVTPSFKLTSTAFVEGGKIPVEHACIDYAGMNRSVPLAWSEVPTNTSKYAVIMDDEVAPCGTGDNACKHWNVYSIPNTITSFTTGQKVTDIGGVNEIPYDGVCAPPAVSGFPTKHTYKITVYALKDTMPAITTQADADVTRSQFKAKYSSHILGEATLSGTFDSAAP